MSRTSHVLVNGFEDIKILMQYLYFDANNYVDVQNAIGVTMRIRITDEGYYSAQNMNFPEFAPTDYTDHMTITALLAIVDQLKEQKATLSSFGSRWDEIQSLVSATVTLNRGYYGDRLDNKRPVLTNYIGGKDIETYTLYV